MEPRMKPAYGNWHADYKFSTEAPAMRKAKRISAGTPVLKERTQKLFLGYFHLFHLVVVLKTTCIEDNSLKPASTARWHIY
jgi:hypothetical protein